MQQSYYSCSLLLSVLQHFAVFDCILGIVIYFVNFTLKWLVLYCS